MKKLISSVLVLVLMLLLVPSALAAGSPRVVLSSQNLKVNGEVITGLEVYNIDGSNYFKLRDVAYLLNGTESQFGVTWDAEHNAVHIEVDAPYEPVGGECEYNGVDKSATAVPTTSEIWFYERVGIEAYNIGGNNFLKLRDLLSYTSAFVDYDASTNTILITTPNVLYSYSYGFPDSSDSSDSSTSSDSSVSSVIEKRMESYRLRQPVGLAGAMALHDELWASGKITSSMNERQIAGVYYNWLVMNVKYDWGMNPASGEAKGVFQNHMAVCDGYSKAYAMLLTIEGIDCVRCSDPDHAWNKVVLDGRMLYIDVTQMRGCFAESGMMSDTCAWQYDDAEYMMAELERCEAWLGWKF